MSGEGAESASGAGASADASAGATSGTTLGITLEASDEYTISYDLNVPEGEEAKPAPASYAPKTVRFGEDTPLPDGDEPTLEGYTFLGWTDMPNGGKTYGSAQADWDAWGKSEKWDKLEDATLYAQWEGGGDTELQRSVSVNPTLNVNFPNYSSAQSVNGGSGTVRLTFSQVGRFFEGSSRTITPPTKDEFEFLGWSWYSTDESKNTQAIWPNYTYGGDFGYNPDGSEGWNRVAKTFYNGNPCMKPDLSWTLSYTPSTYDDWGDWDMSRLYGVWRYIGPGQILFDDNFPAGTGTKTPGVHSKLQGIKNGQNLPKPSDYQAPRMVGYKLDGWYDAKEGGTKYLDANGTSTQTWDKWLPEATLYAHWVEADPNSAQFDDNFPAGTGTETPGVHPDTVQTPGATPVKPAGYRAPAKVGWALEGWYDAKTGSNKYFEANGNPVSGKTWDKAEGAVTPLYAHWTQKTYAISFNRNFPDNNNTTAGTQPASITLKYGDATAIPSGTAYVAPKKTGWVLDGWYDSAASNATKYMNANGTSAKAWDKDVTPATLYAHWTQSRYTITFNRNFPTGSGVGSGATANGNQPNASWTYGGACTAPSGYSAPSKVGYTFEGWYDTNGTKYVNANGTSAKTWDKEGGATLYAHWTQQTYTVTFDRNLPTSGSGTVVNGNQPNASWTYGGACTAPSGYSAPSKVGYTFEGWYDTNGTKYVNANGTSAKTWDKEGGATLYAHWTQQTYTVTFNRNFPTGSGVGSGATANGNQPNASWTYGGACTAPSGYSAPSKVGYALEGWYSAATGGTKYMNANGTSVRSWDQEGGATLYAQWSEKSYSVSYNNNFPTGAPASSTEQGTTYAKQTDLHYSKRPANPTGVAPRKAGYTLLGWWDASSSTGGKQYLNKDGQWIADWDKDAAGETVLYARWEKATYKVTFDDNWAGAANPPEHKRTPNALSATMTFNEVAKAAGGKAPTRVGFTLLGWFDQASGGTQYLDASGKPYNNKVWDKPQDTTLYAHWEATMYLYNFDAQGGTIPEMGGDSFWGPIYISYQDGQTLESALVRAGDATRPGYDFLGWFDSRIGGNQVFPSTEFPAQDKTYYHLLLPHNAYVSFTYQISRWTGT